MTELVIIDDEIHRLINEHGVIVRKEPRGIGLCMYGLWMLIPNGWEKIPAGWLHVLSYAPLIRDKAHVNG